jgi:hypothetical protein
MKEVVTKIWANEKIYVHLSDLCPFKLKPEFSLYPVELVNGLICSVSLEGATSCHSHGLLVCYCVTFLMNVTSHLCLHLPSGVFLLASPPKVLYALVPMCSTCPAHIILLWLIILIIIVLQVVFATASSPNVWLMLTVSFVLKPLSSGMKCKRVYTCSNMSRHVHRRHVSVQWELHEIGLQKHS